MNTKYETLTLLYFFIKTTGLTILFKFCATQVKEFRHSDVILINNRVQQELIKHRTGARSCVESRRQATDSSHTKRILKRSKHFSNFRSVNEIVKFDLHFKCF